MSAQETRRRLLATRGRPVVLTKAGGAAVTVLAHVNLMPRYTDIPGSNVVQPRQSIEILNDEIAAASWPAPPSKPDRIQIDGRTSVIQNAHPVYEGATLIGWSIFVEGG